MKFIVATSQAKKLTIFLFKVGKIVFFVNVRVFFKVMNFLVELK